MMLEPLKDGFDPVVSKQLEDHINTLNAAMEECKNEVRKEWCWRAAMEYIKLADPELDEENKKQFCDKMVENDSLWKDLKVEIGIRPNPNYVPPSS